jgi:hypothetical protein
MIDGEWPALKAAFEAWLDPSNFTSDGRQKCRLEDLRSVSDDTADTRCSGDRGRVVRCFKEAYARTEAVIGAPAIPLEWDYGAILRDCEVWLLRSGWRSLRAF